VHRLPGEVFQKRDHHHTSTKFWLKVIKWVHELLKRPSYMTRQLHGWWYLLLQLGLLLCKDEKRLYHKAWTFRVNKCNCRWKILWWHILLEVTKVCIVIQARIVFHLDFTKHMKFALHNMNMQ